MINKLTKDTIGFMFKKIKYFIQRGKRGYSDRDLWDFRDYLCEIIPKGVRRYKKGMGCPANLWDKEAKNNECHKWGETVEEIAQGFEAVKEMVDFRGCNYEKRLENGAYIFEYDKERAKLLTQKFEKGMDLFKKYFMDLWD